MDKKFLLWGLVGVAVVLFYYALSSNSFLFDAGDALLWGAISTIQLLMPLAIAKSLKEGSRVKNYGYLLTVLGFIFFFYWFENFLNEDPNCNVFCGIQYAANYFFVIPLQLILGFVMLLLHPGTLQRTLRYISIVSWVLFAILWVLVIQSGCFSSPNRVDPWCNPF